MISRKNEIPLKKAIGWYVVWICAATGFAAESDLNAAHSAASRALPTLAKLGSATNFAGLGFESSQEVKSAILGKPIQNYLVRLDELRSYQSTNNPNDLLRPLDKVTFPVLAGEQVRSSIIVEKVRGEWKATNFGGALLAKATVRTISEVPAEQRAETFAVEIPSLNAHFVGFRDNGNLMLVSVFTDPKLNLKAGQPTAAQQVFSDLAPIAIRYNGLPL